MISADPSSDMSLLCAEYALGVLQGDDRRRFELALAMNPVLKDFVMKWAHVFTPLAQDNASSSAEPSIGLFDRIEKKIGLEERVFERLSEHQGELRQAVVVSIATLQILRARLHTARGQSSAAGAA
ncbi:MAG TPA: hypothetical protein VFS42_02775 [Burkholderiaceae bacterium]|nr:hypothetical protein [Burkholderiaceae bacterium]